MKQLTRLLIVALSACSSAPSVSGEHHPAAPLPAPSAPGPSTSVSSATGPASSRPSSVTPVAPDPDPAEPFQPRAPFAVVARAPGAMELAVYPSSDGDAWILGTDRGAKGWSGARWMRIRGSTIETVPPRNEGLSARPSLIASRGDIAWLAVERPDGKPPGPCEVFEWSERAWVSRGRASGPCTHLAPWYPGTAVAAIEQGGGAALAVFGKAPRGIPILDDPPRGSGALANVSALRAWDTGEIALAGTRVFPTPEVWIHRWNGHSPRSASIGTGIDYNSPYVTILPSKEEVWLDGFGVVKGEVETVRLVSRFNGATFRHAPFAHHRLNDFEQMLTSGAFLVGALGEDGKSTGELESYAVEGETLYAVVHTGSGDTAETLLLRNRPVAVGLALSLSRGP